jgi:hypothetical protein
MNYSRLALAALGGTVASFAFGFLVLWLAPALIKEGHKYPAVFRPPNPAIFAGLLCPRRHTCLVRANFAAKERKTHV